MIQPRSRLWNVLAVKKIRIPDMTSKATPLTSHKGYARSIPLSMPDFILIGLAILSAMFYTVLMLELSVSIYFFVPLLVAWIIYWLKSRQIGYSAPLDVPVLSSRNFHLFHHRVFFPLPPAVDMDGLPAPFARLFDCNAWAGWNRLANWQSFFF